MQFALLIYHSPEEFAMRIVGNSDGAAGGKGASGPGISGPYAAFDRHTYPSYICSLAR
jgi:hypothetical protein